MRVIVLSCLLFICARSFSQVKIQGNTTDASGAALSNVSVYLPELLKGTISDANGNFSLNNLKTGVMQAQVSHVGFETMFLRFKLSKDTVINFQLSPSFIQAGEVVVTGTQTQSPRETSFHVEQLRSDDLQKLGSLNVSDAIAKMPGISQLTTGPGISKPVIRGLYGNRIQVNLNGVRFDNQQWQDEHGLGLSDIGIDRIEVIKGPASVLYGSEAIGGVLNIIEERPAEVNTTQQDATVKLFSNTYGLSANYGFKKTTEKNWFRLRAGFDNHADYSDGDNNRVLNSRFDNYNLKLSFGKTKNKWVNANHAMFSFSRFGFVFDSLTKITNNKRLNRDYAGPHHQVFMGQISTENTLFKSDRKKIKLNAGFSSNMRQEDEGGGGISLSMLLNALNVLWQTAQNLSNKSEWIYGASGLVQSNTNLGSRIIVPNAFLEEVSAFSFYKYRSARWLFEAGVRYNQKRISTSSTGTLNTPGSDHPTDEIKPFSRSYASANASVGGAYHLTDELSLKANVSSGFRPGNLAELSSNGLHEGTLRYEIGLPNAKIEQNLNSEVSLLYESNIVKASASVYRNHFWNYFYLTPTGQEYFGFHIYRFQQTDAALQGGEAQVTVNPVNWLDWNTAYSLINAKQDNGNRLPFIPANKLNHEFRFHLPQKGNWTEMQIRLGGNYVFKQSKPAQFETSTPAYFLLNGGFSATNRKMEFALSGNNLLNKTYFDHLSRFKYYGIYNMGRNIVLSIHFKF